MKLSEQMTKQIAVCQSAIERVKALENAMDAAEKAAEALTPGLKETKRGITPMLQNGQGGRFGDDDARTDLPMTKPNGDVAQ